MRALIDMERDRSITYPIKNHDVLQFSYRRERERKLNVKIKSFDLDEKEKKTNGHLNDMNKHIGEY